MKYNFKNCELLPASGLHGIVSARSQLHSRDKCCSAEWSTPFVAVSLSKKLKKQKIIFGIFKENQLTGQLLEQQHLGGGRRVPAGSFNGGRSRRLRRRKINTEGEGRVRSGHGCNAAAAATDAQQQVGHGCRLIAGFTLRNKDQIFLITVYWKNKDLIDQ